MRNVIKKIQKNTYIIPALALIFSTFLFTVLPADAQSGTRPFGGKVTRVRPCPCSPCRQVLHQVGPPRGGKFMYDRCVTDVYAYYQMNRVGVWLLGNYLPKSQACLVFTEDGCRVIDRAQGIMTIVGTSR